MQKIGVFTAFFLLFSVGFSPPQIRAQNQAPEETPRIVADVDFVRVEVSVTKNEKPVFGFTKNDFVVYEDGVEQKISYVSDEPVPLSLLLLIDQSGSLKKHFKNVKGSALKALSVLPPKDEVAVIGFDHRLLKETNFTTDREGIAEILSGIESDDQGGTNIVDAIRYGIEKLKGVDPSRRRAVILLSDNLHGGDIPPQVKSILLKMAAVNEVAIYNVKHGGAFPNTGAVHSGSGEQLMRELVHATGGQMIDARRGNPLKAFALAIERLKNTYSIYYKPADKEKVGLRKVEAKLKDNPRMKRYLFLARQYEVVGRKEYYYKPKQ